MYFTSIDFGFDEGLLECYKPQTNTLRDMDMAFSLTESNRPSLCFKLCSDYTYTFAGVMGYCNIIISI